MTVCNNHIASRCAHIQIHIYANIFVWQYTWICVNVYKNAIFTKTHIFFWCQVKMMRWYIFISVRYVCTRVCIYIYVLKYFSGCVYTHMCMYKWWRRWSLYLHFTHIYMCIYIYIYTYICIYIHMYI